MPVSPEFRDFAVEQLGRIVPVSARPMFGGVGLYADGLFFGLMDDDLLYLKTGAGTRARYEAAGMPAFQPIPGSPPMAYHQVPPELIETPEALRPWVEEALEVARSARRKKR